MHSGDSRQQENDHGNRSHIIYSKIAAGDLAIHPRIAIVRHQRNTCSVIHPNLDAEPARHAHVAIGVVATRKGNLVVNVFMVEDILYVALDLPPF